VLPRRDQFAGVPAVVNWNGGADQLVAWGRDRFNCTEALFQPSIAGVECEGFHELITKCINRADCNNKEELWRNIVLSGGNTAFENIAQRLEFELKNLNPEVSHLIRVKAAPERSMASWIGGSIIASLPCCFYNWWVSAEDYDEEGFKILERKCD